MASRKRKLPKLYLHNGTGYWCVNLAGRRKYLSRDQSEAVEKYAQVCKQLGDQPEVVGPVRVVGDLCTAYLEWASTVKYVKRGKPTAQVDRIRGALRPLWKLHELTPLSNFDEFALEAVQSAMVADGLARGEINARIGCVKRMFRWAAGRRMIDGRIAGQLQLVEGLRRGCGRGRETAPVEPVADDIVDRTLPLLSPTLRAMVELQRLTGMRPGEVCHIRPGDIDRSGDVWIYTVAPEWSKLAHFGIARTVFLGPAAQAILTPFLEIEPRQYCFEPMPRRSEPCYNRRTYARAIARAIECARKDWRPPLVLPPEHWHPNQLRHAAGTRIRAQAGLDAAQGVLGHSSREMTERYAKLEAGSIRDVVRRIG